MSYCALILAVCLKEQQVLTGTDHILRTHAEPCIVQSSPSTIQYWPNATLYETVDKYQGTWFLFPANNFFFDETFHKRIYNRESLCPQIIYLP